MQAICCSCTDSGQALVGTVPIETGARIGLATRRDFAVSADVLDRITLRQDSDQIAQSLVLRGLKGYLVTTLKFDPNRKIVAAFTLAPRGNASVPRARITTDKLNEFAVTADQEMRGHPQHAERFKIGMPRRIETIGEKILDVRTAEFARRQADCMDDDKINDGAVRPGIEVRRGDATSRVDPSVVANT